MKVLLQNLKTGVCYLDDLPMPQAKKDFYVVRSTVSLVSTGTEKMLVRFGQSSWIEKLRQQPEKVEQVVAKMKNEGIAHTLAQVQLKLDQPIPLGYCNVGVIAQTHPENDLKVGDRVVCNGSHAEYNLIPKNLCVKIPDNVSDEDAAFAIPGAIALQGMRLAKPQLGERIVVIGLGLIGILTVKLLHANGCEVVALDISEDSLSKAKSLGITCFNLNNYSAQQLYDHYFNGTGADAVIITAATDAPLLNDAAAICRTRGKIVLVGVVGREFSRDAFYKKEISFQVSCSYGPGRYDPNYEEKGMDYPLGFVRWTAKRNIETLLRLLEDKKLDVAPLIQQNISLEEAPEKIYSRLDQLKLANLIRYRQPEVMPQKRVILKDFAGHSGKPVIGMIGLGQFALSVILPALKKAGAQIKCLQSQQTNVAHAAKKYQICEITSDPNVVLNDPSINTVIISTRHASHGPLVIKAIEHNKAVFVEKPLCIQESDLLTIEGLVADGAKLKVGFNRSYSSKIEKIKKLIEGMESMLCINYTINAGYVHPTHWIMDPQQGGRILGELCHYIDLCADLTQSQVIQSNIVNLGENASATSDNIVAQLKFENGSIASIQYFANGHKKQSKEELEIFCAGKIIQLTNFKNLKVNGIHQSANFFSNVDKGHRRQFAILANSPEVFFNKKDALRAIHTTRVCFDLLRKLQLPSAHS